MHPTRHHKNIHSPQITESELRPLAPKRLRLIGKLADQTEAMEGLLTCTNFVRIQAVHLAEDGQDLGKAPQMTSPRTHTQQVR